MNVVISFNFFLRAPSDDLAIRDGAACDELPIGDDVPCDELPIGEGVPGGLVLFRVDEPRVRVREGLEIPVVLRRLSASA